MFCWVFDVMVGFEIFGSCLERCVWCCVVEKEEEGLFVVCVEEVKGFVGKDVG